MGAAEKIEKLDGECTEELFWSEVAFIGWGDRGFDYRARKGELLNRWTQEFARSFNEVLERFDGRLDKALNLWERETGNQLSVGDDSYGDLKAHLIGRGKKMYEAVLKDPSIGYEAARDGTYIESFSYCIPNGGDPDAQPSKWQKEEYTSEELGSIMQQRRMGDWSYLDPERYKQRAQEELEGYREALDHPLSTPIRVELALAISILFPLAEQGDYGPLLERKQELDEAVERISKHVDKLHEDVINFRETVPNWGMKNLSNDVESYLK